jgi:hypothetical protein
MESQLTQSRASFSFHLDGDNEIDAILLSRTINDVVQLTKLAAKEEDPEAYMKMNVTAFRNGSFQIDFSAICEQAINLLPAIPQAANLASSAVATVKGYLEIKKLLKGKAPKTITQTSEETAEVENAYGEKALVPKSSTVIINNSTIDQLAINISGYAQAHNPSGGFSISTPAGMVACSAEDVANMTKPLPITSEVLCKRLRREAELLIKKADVLGNSSWEFILDDHVIRARVDDDFFMEQVHSGAVTIKANDYVSATLEVYVELDDFGKPVENSEKYNVVKIHGTIKHDYCEQTSFL